MGFTIACWLYRCIRIGEGVLGESIGAPVINGVARRNHDPVAINTMHAHGDFHPRDIKHGRYGAPWHIHAYIYMLIKIKNNVLYSINNYFISISYL